MIRIGIDLGGTKIAIIALDADGQTRFEQRVATPKGDYLATLDAVVALVAQCERTLGQQGSVGVGIPGALSNKNGLVKNANSVCLIGQDLKGDLQRRLQREVFVANDANCFALSEAVDGSAKGAKVVFGVIIGTGCGGGVVMDGQVLTGVNWIGGEWGHNPLPWAVDAMPLDCYCGQKGCIETFLSGTGLQNHYQQRSGVSLEAKQIMALAEQGVKQAHTLRQDYIVWLAKGLASVINLLDPDVIVLGGGMSNIQCLYTEVPKIWDQWIFSNEPALTKLVAPTFGDASGVRGAAWLAHAQQNNAIK
ncbi:N-acetylglucosamine kinase [Thiosulfatimonas sediminis]|uniref:N-acetylglucosamine kinase n=1 Tax=Thiosulfatimonas sediminis TaxID=2675054 RepID=A0A6F8PVQ7_9GAMM|nr:ROK family protein [Thiosulfatimonas sediminis]BBP46232.1 N-acetylglucosamine kinase [Thiosulfatimonas sediminis]